MMKTFCIGLLAIVFSCSFISISSVSAYQISPNPNEGTINVTSEDAENDKRFVNAGDVNIKNHGTIDNVGSFYNLLTGTLTLSGDFGGVTRFYNNGDFKNIFGLIDIKQGSFINSGKRGTFANSGRIKNGDRLQNAYLFINDGVIDNNGYFYNYTFGDDGTIFNNGIINNNETINNEAVINNTDSIFNFDSGRIESTGILNNYKGGEIQNSGFILSRGDFNNWGSLVNQTDGHISASGEFVNQFGSDIKNSGRMQIGSSKNSFENFGTFENIADGNISNSSFFYNQRGATFTNDAIFSNFSYPFGNNPIYSYFFNSGIVENKKDGMFENHGELHNNQDGSFYNSGTIRNQNEIHNGSHLGQDYDAKIFVNEKEGVIENNGKITNYTSNRFDNSGTVVNKGAFYNHGLFTNYGTYTGTGNFHGTFINSGGIIAPGNSPGSTTINGDLLFNSGTLQVEIGGTGLGEYDQLFVDGTATFTVGMFEFLQWNYYRFQDDILFGETQEWEFLHADGGIFGFDNLTVSFTQGWLPEGFDADIYLRDNSLWLSISNSNNSSVPIPSTFMLFFTGLLCLAGINRKLKHIKSLA